MKNKEFHKLLKKNKFKSNSKSNSGFTLTELLVGLIMSTFVIGALGFGLMQILRVTQKGNSETAARNESSRALDFISDEMRRANAIEVKMSDPDINVVSADYKNHKKTGATVRLALQVPELLDTERIIYSVAEPEDPWKGPLVIYRWGPNLNANGDYTDADDSTNWKNLALVDGMSDKDQDVNCDNNGDGTAETITYKGFFACVIDDDGDVILDAAGNPIKDAAGKNVKENATDNNSDGNISFADDSNDKNGDGKINFGDTLTDTNGDGKIDFADSTLDINRDGKVNNEDRADTDGIAITAQLYFSGGTKVGDGINTGTYSADTKTVARARTAPESNSSGFSRAYIAAFRTLDPKFSCNQSADWGMRTDFGSELTKPSDIDKWDHEEDRQPQPIEVNGDKLVISSIPMSKSGEVDTGTDCLNTRANNGREDTDPDDPRNFEGNKGLDDSADWVDDETVVAISHSINFKDPRTFNGDHVSCAISPCPGHPDGKVFTQKDGEAAAENPYVLMLKNGSPIPDTLGYDMNGNGDYTDLGDQISLREFLKSKGLTTDDGTKIKDEAIGNDERIIAFEIGKDNVSDTTVPGVDFQDNVFILRSDAFSQKYKTYSDNYSDADDYEPQDYFINY